MNQAQIESVLSKAYFSGRLETGLYQFGKVFVVVDFVNDDLSFQWFSGVEALGDVTADLQAIGVDLDAPVLSYQNRVQAWLHACFGSEVSANQAERNHRFFEEAVELVQACGCTQAEANQLVDYVYSRPVGKKEQEVGGVMIGLSGLCLAQGIDFVHAGETELSRVWTVIDQIRAKQAAKPAHSPLPGILENT